MSVILDPISLFRKSCTVSFFICTQVTLRITTTGLVYQDHDLRKPLFEQENTSRESLQF